jgi:NADPH-dependent 2,4-dienoyl-CoA reductase/sulfur reductase-like enzyme
MWRDNMPAGMFLKSEGFASSLYDPYGNLPLRRYCSERGLPYADVNLPVALATFIEYGLEFQARFAPHLDRRSVKRLIRVDGSFILRLGDESEISARRVVLATGIDYYRHIPAELTQLAPHLLTHSADYGDVKRLAGKRVAVIGRGASALDIAVLSHEAGAEVHVIGRSPTIAYHPPPPPRRGPRTRLRYPISAVGPGWRNVFYCEAPGLFRLLPADRREEQVRTWLGPAPGWFIRRRAEGKFPVHLGWHIAGGEAAGSGVDLRLRHGDGQTKTLQVDHVVCATGFRTEIARLPFLDEPLKHAIATLHGAPLLSRNFESSVADLFIVGPSAALTFGPVMRFAVGAEYTASRLGRHLRKSAPRISTYSDGALTALEPAE